MEQKDYHYQLREVQQKRSELETTYRLSVKRLEEADYNISINSRELYQRVMGNKYLSSDKALNEIFSEREDLLSNMRRQQMEFDEYINEQYRKEMSQLDEEEYEIKKMMAEEETETKTIREEEYGYR